MPQGRSPQASARGNSCPSQYVLNTEIWRHKTTIHLPNTCTVILSSTLLFLRHMVPTPSDIIPDEADNCSNLVLLFLCCGSHVTFLSMTRFANPAEDISQDRADATACHDLWVVFFLMYWLSWESTLQCQALQDAKEKSKLAYKTAEWKMFLCLKYQHCQPVSSAGNI